MSNSRTSRCSLRRLVAGVITLATPLTATLTVTASPAQAATTPGIDVSHYQGAINWTSVRNAGIQFAFIKATEGVSYRDPRFDTNYVGAYNAGVIRGAYHFALPDRSTGAVQANYLASNGGAWSADSRTLPPRWTSSPTRTARLLRPEPGRHAHVGHRFPDHLPRRTGRYAVIYTTTSWWTSCTGNWSGPWANHPLWIARWASTPRHPAGRRAVLHLLAVHEPPAAVSGISGTVDRNYFNGVRSRLVALANNT